MSGFSFSGASCGHDGVSAGIMGAVNGVLGVFGLGGVLGNTSQQDAQKALSDAQNQLNNEATKWKDVLRSQQLQNIIYATEISDKMTQAATAQQNVVDEILSEKIQTNSLMISTLAILVVFLIFYDIL